MVEEPKALGAEARPELDFEAPLARQLNMDIDSNLEFSSDKPSPVS